MCFDLISTLPQEIKHEILTNLDARMLSRCCCLNKLWQKIASENTLWKKLYPHIEFPLNASIKMHLDTHVITSKKQLLERVQHFINKITFDKSGYFHCSFPFDKDCFVTIKLGYGMSINENYDLKEECLFLKKIPPGSSKWGMTSNPATSKNLALKNLKLGPSKINIAYVFAIPNLIAKDGSKVTFQLAEILENHIAKLIMEENKRLIYEAFYSIMPISYRHSLNYLH